MQKFIGLVAATVACGALGTSTQSANAQAPGGGSGDGWELPQAA